MTWFLRRLLRDRRGAALAEYGLLLAGITLVSLGAVAVLGGKVGGLVGAVSSILPGAYERQNAPVVVGELLETRISDVNGDGVDEISIDMVGISDQKSNTPRLGSALGLDSHGSSHLYQLGSQKNRHHGGQ
jgi:Flp pilus assembly pilin Flp